jgi:hypothetical protein
VEILAVYHNKQAISFSMFIIIRLIQANNSIAFGKVLAAGSPQHTTPTCGLSRHGYKVQHTNILIMFQGSSTSNKF